MRALFLVAPILLSCSGGSSSKKPDTKPNGGEVTGKGTRGFDEYPRDYGADEYGNFYYDGYEGYDEDYSEPAYTPPPPMPPALAGTWKGTCEAGDKDSKRLTFVFTDTRWDLDLEKFADTTCTKRTTLVEVGGGYTFGAESTKVAGAWDAVFSLDTRDVTADDKKTAKALGKDCKLKKLEAGKPTSLLDAGCAKLGMKKLAECAGEYDVVAVTGITLQLGVRPSDNDLCTEDKRPTALEAAHALTMEVPSNGIPECDALFQRAFSIVNCPNIPAGSRDSIAASFRDMVQIYTTADMCNAVLPQFEDAIKAMGC